MSSDDGLYDGALGAYDDYSDYMMTSGLGGVGGGVDVDDDTNNIINNGMLGAGPARGAPAPTAATGARAFKKARMEEEEDDDDDEEDGEGKNEAKAAAEPKTPQEPKGSETIQPDGGNVGRHSSNEGAASDGGHDDDEDEEGVEEDPQAAAFRQHTQGQLERVCTTLQTCLQDLAEEFMSYYHASVHVKGVYEQVLAKERAESRRLDALEPQVQLLNDLVRSTAGMGCGGQGGGTGGSAALATAPSATARPTAGAKAMLPMQGRPRQPPQPLHRHVQQSMRHPSHGN